MRFVKPLGWMPLAEKGSPTLQSTGDREPRGPIVLCKDKHFVLVTDLIVEARKGRRM